MKERRNEWNHNAFTYLVFELNLKINISINYYVSSIYCSVQLLCFASQMNTDFQCILCRAIYIFYFYLFKHLSQVAEFVITFHIDCIGELKKGAPKVFKKR